MNQRCDNCGAPASSSGPDVRKGVCAYCGFDLSISIDSAQIAAGMQLDMANAQAFLQQLARALGHAFGPRTKVEWSQGQIVKVSVELGSDMFVALLDIDTIIAQKKKLVRGVALKTAIHPIEVWVPLLHTAIAAHVNTNAKAQAALAQLRIS
jgi:hypothetical protein